MDKKDYFKNLIRLFEASDVNPEENEAPVDQGEIADDGSDVDPNAQSAPEENQMPDETQIPEAPDILDPTAISEKEKFKKLFDLFEDLLNYINVFSDSLKVIDIGLLDQKVFIKVKKYMSNIDSLGAKIKNYLINYFNQEKYERVLYSYILFRTEMITLIKSLRDVLQLDKVDSEENDKK